MEDLASHGIEDLGVEELSASRRKYISNYFKKKILPLLAPIIIGPHHPLPNLINKCNYIAVLLKDKKGKNAVGFVPVPIELPAYISLPDTDLKFVRMEAILHHWSDLLFGSYRVLESCILSITRNADISFDDEKFEDSDKDFRNKVIKLLKKRDRLSVMRMEISEKISDTFLQSLTKLIAVDPTHIYVDSCPLVMDCAFQLVEEISPSKRKKLVYRNYEARWPEDISPEHSMIQQIQKKDKLLYYPFDSMDPFLNLLSEAAENPDVLSIKITIYRLASSSKIARILSRAAENGIEVIVFMELRARFDEANNVIWSRVLEDAGCQVVYGIEKYKCHSKICLITMRSQGELSYITLVGTGNYNETTSPLYTDLSLMTASQSFGEDATLFFQHMLINNLEGEYDTLLVSPNGIKSALLDLMDEEIAKGKDGYICMKVNSITERQVIEKLHQASQSGVEVQLIVRGICCLLPGIPGYTDNIQVTSIVGRYLEHARIYCFGKGLEAKYYLSSADLMTRNLNHRVEIACPVLDQDLKKQLKWILSTQLADNVKASFMMPEGLYSRKVSFEALSMNSQEEFMKTSIHRPTEFVPPTKSVLERFRSYLQWVLGE